MNYLNPFLDFTIFKNVTTELGYRLSNEEIEEILETLHQESRLDVDKFTEIMNIVEKKYLRKNL
jgi:Ca2+-binding EF-hand superfamily protein